MHWVTYNKVTKSKPNHMQKFMCRPEDGASAGLSQSKAEIKANLAFMVGCNNKY